MRVLLTGASGFVGLHLSAALPRICGPDATVIATAKVAEDHAILGPVATLDVTDYAAAESAIVRYAPTHVLHLAGIAAPASARADPEAAWGVHVHGTLNLARAILAKAPDCWLLNVGSGLIYGDSASLGLPLDEHTLLAPTDEYSATKAAADLALGALTRAGLKCIRLRPFNHTGPGQSEAFVLPAFAMQIARIEAGLAAPVMRVGNLEAERDFLDVRDVAVAYALAVQRSEELEPGVILNIASGVARPIRDVLDRLLAQSRVKITVEQDPDRLRPSDLPRIVGSADRARKLLGWVPEHRFDDTLAAVLNDCRTRSTSYGPRP